MIRIVKSSAPLILSSTGSKETTKSCTDYDNGQRDFRFKPSIYAASAVKDALRKDQNNKCAYCESQFSHVAYGDVEHYRPKAGYKQSEHDPLVQPGYYWLAYDWANLFLTCQICNQKFKRNLFPLADERKRAHSHRHNLNQEKPLLICPSENPNRQLSFREEYTVGYSRKGQMTIEIAGLNRDELVEKRREKLQNIKWVVELINILEVTIQKSATAQVESELRELRTILKASQYKTGEYSSMIRA